MAQTFYVYASWLRIQDNAQFTTYHETQDDCLVPQDMDKAFDKMSESYPWVTGWRLMALNVFSSKP